LPSRFWASGAATIAAALVLGACSSSSPPSQDARLAIYVSAPLHGPRAGDGREVVDAAKLALADSGGRSVGIRVEGVYLDDSERGRDWDQATTAANARLAVEDSTAIAYVGELDSGASRVSEPIINQASILQISPGASAVDLVQPFPGSTRVPEDLQPSGDRTFGRVVPDDEAQARAGALWTERLGVRRASVESDRSAFGRELATGYREAIQRVKITHIGGQLLYYAGLPNDQPASLTQSFRGHVMASDAELGVARFEPRGSLFTSAALDPSQLPMAGRQFAREFEHRYDRPPGRYAAYGYEAMALALHSIAAAEDPLDRESVIDAFFATRNRDSVLGRYSIDEVGDTTLDRLTGYRLGRQGLEPVTRLAVP
jgi:branched-chain amino acid transport system substrate-binding protein